MPARISLLLLIFLSGLNVYLPAAVAQKKYRHVTSDTITSGVIYEHIKGIKDSLDIHLVEINLLHPGVHIESGRAHQSVFGREKTSGIARSYSKKEDSVLVAINADFFNLETGENENNQVAEGSIVRGTRITDSPHDVFDNVHSQFAITQKKESHIGRFRFDGSIILNDVKLQIDRINSSSDSSKLVLYNSYYGTNSAGAGSGDMPGVNLVLEKLSSRLDTTYYLVKRKFATGGQPIPPNGAVLAGFGKVSQRLKKFFAAGDTLISVLQFSPDVGQIRTLVGGWPRIVKDGQNIAEKADSVEGTFPEFSRARHPRTGVGFSRDSSTVYFITVDGRQESSVGMTLAEFADLMLSEGVYQGLNLDGGGSTTMVIKGRIVNSPSDKNGERPVGNALLLFSRK